MSLHRFNPLRMLQWRNSVRLDVRRAVLAIGGVGGALALVYIFVIKKPPEKIVEQGFGFEWRTGSILVVPLSGDVCQQSVFDNDGGTIWPLEPVACTKVIRDFDKSAASTTTPGHVETVSQNFRR